MQPQAIQSLRPAQGKQFYEAPSLRKHDGLVDTTSPYNSLSTAAGSVSKIAPPPPPGPVKDR